MCSENHPQPGSGCIPRGLSCVPRAVIPSSCSCLLGGYLAYLTVRMVGHTSVTSPPCHCSQGSRNFLLSLIPSPPPFRGTAYLVSVTLAQAKGQRRQVGLWKGILLAKTFHDLRVANSLAASKVIVAISEVSRDSRHTQVRCWRMASTCSLLPSDTCSSCCFSTPLSTVHLMCPQEGDSWGTDLWAALKHAQGFVLSCTGRWGSHAEWVPEPSQPKLGQSQHCSYQGLLTPWEKLPPALWGVGSIWPLSAATSSSLLCVCS